MKKRFKLIARLGNDDNLTTIAVTDTSYELIPIIEEYQEVFFEEGFNSMIVQGFYEIPLTLQEKVDLFIAKRRREEAERKEVYQKLSLILGSLLNPWNKLSSAFANSAASNK